MAGKGNTAKDTETQVATAEAQAMRPAQQAFREMLRDLASVATESTDDFAGDDLFAILSAETDEQMWDGDEQPTINAKVLSGCEIEVFGFEVKFSKAQQSADPAEAIQTILVDPATGRNMYLLVRSARLNRTGNEQVYRLPEVGEQFTWNTSARYIVAKLYKLGTWGRFANGHTVKCRIQGTDLGAGRSVEKLKDLSAPTVGGATEQAAEPPF
jgi:hypothetical protein